MSVVQKKCKLSVWNFIQLHIFSTLAVKFDWRLKSAVDPVLAEFKMLRDNKYCDVTFVVEGKEFPAHKLILASRCLYFDRYCVLYMHCTSMCSKVHTRCEPCRLTAVKHGSLGG